MWLSFICKCSHEEGCCNPYTNRSDVEDVPIEDVEEEGDEGDKQEGIEMDDIVHSFNQGGESHEVIVW